MTKDKCPQKEVNEEKFKTLNKRVGKHKDELLKARGEDMHDIKNYITRVEVKIEVLADGIKALSETLVRQDEKDKNQKEKVEKIEKQIESMQSDRLSRAQSWILIFATIGINLIITYI